MKKKQLKGQILVIVLLVLTIMAVFIMSITANTRRDIFERIRSEQYEQYYSIAEKRLLQMIQETKIASNINSITTEFGCIYTSSTRTYKCNFSDVPETGSLDQTATEVTIVDTNQINGLPISKDTTFEVNLSGITTYTINMSWTGSKVAWILTLDLVNNAAGGTGEYIVVKDIYDRAGVTQPVTQTHAFTFQPLVIGGVTQPATNNLSVNLATGRPAGYTIKALRLKPLIKGNEQLTELTLSGPANLPPQVRRFTSKSISSQQAQTGTSTPVAILEVQVPLNAPPAEILDYVLRSETDVVVSDPPIDDGVCRVGYYTNDTRIMYYWDYPSSIPASLPTDWIGYVSPFKVRDTLNSLTALTEFKFLRGIGGVEYEYKKGDSSGTADPTGKFTGGSFIPIPSNERASAASFSNMDIVFIGEFNLGQNYNNDMIDGRRNVSIPALTSALVPGWKNGMNIVLASDNSWGLAPRIKSSVDNAALTTLPLLNALAGSPTAPAGDQLRMYNGDNGVDVLIMNTNQCNSETPTGKPYLPTAYTYWGVSSPGLVWPVKPGGVAECLFTPPQLYTYSETAGTYGSDICEGGQIQGRVNTPVSGGNMELPGSPLYAAGTPDNQKFCLLSTIPPNSLTSFSGKNGFLIMDANAGKSVYLNMKTILESIPDCKP